MASKSVVLLVLIFLSTSSQAAVQCQGGMDQFCESTTPSTFDFVEAGGVATGGTASCCKGSFTQCQVQENVQYSRALMFYSIPTSQALAEAVCDVPSNPDCNCQEVLRLPTFLRMNFCPESVPCCTNCECHGDPHCTSFQGELATWAVCDNRDESCTHQADTCELISYDGKPCEWVNGQCKRNPDTQIPEMDMYTKQYKNYFDSTDDTVHHFRLSLQLTVYGATGQIHVQDSGVDLVFGLGADSCTTPPGYPLRGGKVSIDNLPSGVILQFTCISGFPKNRRWDVTQVIDPWYVPDHPAVVEFGGFCATNVIAESEGQVSLGCRILDRQIATHFQCKFSSTIEACKRSFCQRKSKSMSFDTPAKQVECNAFVHAHANNFLIAACSLSKLYPINPHKCLEDQVCKKCVDDILDFPEEMTSILNEVVRRPALAAEKRAKCPANLLAIGLARPELSPVFSGVQIDFQEFDTVEWKPIFSLLDSEIEVCGGCRYTLVVNGTSPANQAMVQPGRYRVIQKTGLDTDPNQDLCESAPGYNATITYTNPTGNTAAVGTPLGIMFQDGRLVCSPQVFPNCPVGYACCIWDRNTEPFAWADCMQSYPGGGAAFPDCN